MNGLMGDRHAPHVVLNRTASTVLELGSCMPGMESPIPLQVNSLRELVEDWDFQEEPFMEFVASALQLLAGLLHNSGELETQLQVCFT